MDRKAGACAASALLDALVVKEFDRVLDVCAERVVAIFWGSAPVPALVCRGDLVSWFSARDALSDGGVRTQLLAMSDAGGTRAALLRHDVDRGGLCYSYETLDRLAARDGEVVAWFSRPVDRSRYAWAWGIGWPRLDGFDEGPALPVTSEGAPSSSAPGEDPDTVWGGV